PVRFLSVTYSMPEWIIQLWMNAYGIETVTVMLESLLSEKKVSIRMKPDLSGEQRQELIGKMENSGIVVTQSPYLDYAYRISNLEGLTKVPGFLEGFFTVQDVSSMLIGEIAACKEGDRIIDVCAAPGGKSIHLAEKLKNTGMVEARDLTENKVAKIQENIDRMGLKNIKALVYDALETDEKSFEKADIVIGDLPCSGLGVIGKKADIKYNVSKESLLEITQLQKQILKQVLNYVKPGGAFIYSTCTINKAENEDMVQWIVQNFPYELESIDPYIPAILQSETTKCGYLQLLPGVHQTDGFFMARLIRKSL
ncbi:MAG: 16S rRNA (cytosine(967)-C(5))-methyltransferase RsmB, partial [Clostridiales bacterium]|nr:16S rRNA (cytosine(967)-C(5))-methyltransferase RsmB [Clostridiales bacterium]